MHQGVDSFGGCVCISSHYIIMYSWQPLVLRTYVHEFLPARLPLMLLPCSGVTVHCGLQLLHYNEGVAPEEGEGLRSVTFQPTQDSDAQPLRIECEVSSLHV